MVCIYVEFYVSLVERGHAGSMVRPEFHSNESVIGGRWKKKTRGAKSPTNDGGGSMMHEKGGAYCLFLADAVAPDGSTNVKLSSID